MLHLSEYLMTHPFDFMLVEILLYHEKEKGSGYVLRDSPRAMVTLLCAVGQALPEPSLAAHPEPSLAAH